MEDINFLKSSADFSVVQGKPLCSWVRNVGILYIVLGSILCVGIITAIAGIPLIISGRQIIRAYDNMKNFSQSNSYYNLTNAIDNLNIFFKLTGIILSISLCIIVLGIIAAIILKLTGTI